MDKTLAKRIQEILKEINSSEEDLFTLYDLMTNKELNTTLSKYMDTKKLDTISLIPDVLDSKNEDDMQFLEMLKYLPVAYDEKEKEYEINIDRAGECEQSYYTDPNIFLGNFDANHRIIDKLLPELLPYLRAVTVDVHEALEGEKLPFTLYLGGTMLVQHEEHYDSHPYVELNENIDMGKYIFMDKDGNDISGLPNYTTLAKTFGDKIKEGMEKVEEIYGFSAHHSKLEENLVAVNLKLHNMDSADEDKVKAKLLEMGYDKEDVDEAVTQNAIQAYADSKIDFAISELSENGSYNFKGMTGRMGGYGIFELNFPVFNYQGSEYEDRSYIDFADNGELDLIYNNEISSGDIDTFSTWIEERHKSLLNCGDELLEYTVEGIADDLMLPKEKEAHEKEIEFQRSRKFTDIETPTGEFRMNGTAWITHWGETLPPEGELGGCYIEMDEVRFSSIHLNSKQIFENLNDGQFGVLAINGATDLSIEEKINVVRTFEDNGETKNFSYEETRLEDGEIIGADDPNIMMRIYANAYTPVVPLIEEEGAKKKDTVEQSHKEKTQTKENQKKPQKRSKPKPK